MISTYAIICVYWLIIRVITNLKHFYGELIIAIIFSIYVILCGLLWRWGLRRKERVRNLMIRDSLKRNDS